MLRLSFIVPFYNVEPYIEECIRSLYNQDIPWEEYEVICIDDCSPDGSRAIVERLQQEYPTLKLLRTPENLRQGGARNMGLDIAQGKYIWFVDSDDYIIPNCLKKLLQQAEDEDLDILDFDFDSDWLKQSFRKNVESFDMGICSGTEYVFNESHGGRWSWRCSCVWGGLIKRTLMEGLRFRGKVQYEDNDYALLLYAKAQRVHHIPEQPYYYRVVEKSTVNVKIGITQVSYNVDLITAYVRVLEHGLLEGERWQKGVEELINWTASQIISQIQQLDDLAKDQYYTQFSRNLLCARKYLGRKVMFALSSKLIYKLLYK